MIREKPTIHGGTLIRWIGSLLSIALLVYLISQQGWDEILASAASIPRSSLVIVIGLLIISRLAVSLRWFSLIKAVEPEFPFRESLRLTLAGLFAANFLPTTVGGDVIRVAGVLRRTKNRMDAATSIAADRLIGLTGMAMLVPFGLFESWGWIVTQVEQGSRSLAVPGQLSSPFLGFLKGDVFQGVIGRLKTRLPLTLGLVEPPWSDSDCAWVYLGSSSLSVHQHLAFITGNE